MACMKLLEKMERYCNDGNLAVTSISQFALDVWKSLYNEGEGISSLFVMWGQGENSFSISSHVEIIQHTCLLDGHKSTSSRGPYLGGKRDKFIRTHDLVCEVKMMG